MSDQRRTFILSWELLACGTLGVLAWSQYKSHATTRTLNAQIDYTVENLYANTLFVHFFMMNINRANDICLRESLFARVIHAAIKSLVSLNAKLFSWVINICDKLFFSFHFQTKRQSDAQHIIPSSSMIYTIFLFRFHGLFFSFKLGPGDKDEIFGL